MPDLLDLLSPITTGSLTVNGVTLSWSEMWALSGRAASSIQERGGRVACLLENSHEAVAVVLGGLRSGSDIASLPLPHRGESTDAYLHHTTNLMRKSGFDVLAASESVASLLENAPFPVVTFNELCAGDISGLSVGGGRLVQFTSGSTGTPKGIPLTSEQLGANVAATQRFLGLNPEWTIVTWLPLSHDMGLIGTLLTPWLSGMRCYLSTPERFALRPLSWLDDMSTTGARISAAPNFALEFVLRALPRAKDHEWDLSNVSSIIIGGEVNKPETLRRFANELARFGLDPRALSPAYGMAEAALAVSLTSPLTPWRVAHITSDSLLNEAPVVVGDLVAGHLALPVPDGCVECVVSGTVLPEYSVTADRSGMLLVDGPSLYDGYLGGERRVGPHETRDLGVVVEGNVVVIGRRDEVILVRGRNLHPLDVESACEPFVRRGCIAAVPDGSGGLAVVAESGRGGTGVEVARDLRRAVSQGTGIAPAVVVFVQLGSLEKTPSGKVRRRRIAQRLDEGTLKVVARHQFGQ